MKNVLTFLCIFFTSIMHCPAQNYNWITGGGSTEAMTPAYNYETVTGLCTDIHGNVYITATVGKTNIKADTFYEALAHNVNTSVSHILFASYKCDGTMRWAKVIECSNSTIVGNQLTGVGNQDLAYINGNIYFVGSFYGGTKYIGFDTSFTNNPSSFTSKFDTDGHFKWIRFVGPDVATTPILTGDAGVVSIDGQGYIHNFNFVKKGVLISSTFTSDTTGTYDLKYDSLGNLISANRIQLDSVWLLSKAIFNKIDNKFYSILSVNSSYWYTYYANQNSAVSAFEPNGNLIWIDTTGQNGLILGLTYDGNDGLYACGNGFDTFNFGGLTVANTIFPAYYSFAPIIKLDTNGRSHWLYNLQSNLSVDLFYDIEYLPNYRLAACGVLGGLSIHGADTINSTPGEQSNPLFIILDSSGRTVKLDQFHGPGNVEQGNCIASDAGSNVYVGGMLDLTMTATGISTYTTNGGNTDFFLLKYGYNDCDSLISLSTPQTPLAGATQPVTVYPNPANEALNIAGVTEPMVYHLLSISGIVASQGSLQPGINTLSTRGLPPGMYLLEMTGADGVKQVARIVVE